MRDYFRELDSHFSRWLTPVVKWVVYLCVGMLLVELLVGIEPACRLFGASLPRTILHLQLWQLFTYMVVHASFGHLFFNLFSLWVFGSRFEGRWGSQWFGKFVLVVGAGSVGFHLLVQAAMGARFWGEANTIIGISGVVYGVLLAYAYCWPDDYVYLYGMLPVKVKHLALVLFIITFVSSWNPASPIAHLTHLGGLAVGYLCVRFPRWLDRIPVPRLPWGRRSRNRRNSR
jgi:membrane associated rhomboid family serine protease